MNMVPMFFLCLPLIKISKNAVSSWLQKADELIQEGKTNVYETEAFKQNFRPNKN